MSKIEKAVCQIALKSSLDIMLNQGTGFFIEKNLILTCSHVLDSDFSDNGQTNKIEIENCEDQNGLKLSARLVAKCDDCDLAILRLNEDFSNAAVLDLYGSEVARGEKIHIFGYPDNSHGSAAGEELNGKTGRFIKINNVSAHDTTLEINNFAPNTEYNGFSGSPVVNEHDQVISIVSYQEARNLGSISIMKAAGFLKKNRVVINLHKPSKKVRILEQDKKTFIGGYKENPHYITRFFSKKSGQEESSYSENSGEVLSLSKILEKKYNIFLLGNPGIGKSTELMRFAHEIWKTGETDDFVPIHLSLRNFTFSNTLEDYLPTRWKKLHKVIFILDGIDEIADTLDFESKLESFIRQHAERQKIFKYVISCRTNVYHSLFLGVSGFEIYYLEDLKQTEGLALLKNKCGSKIDGLEFEGSLLNFLKTPFQIDILARYINEQQLLPASVTALWDQYIKDRLLHDQSKKQKKTNLNVPLIKSCSSKVGLINELMKTVMISQSHLSTLLKHNSTDLTEFRKNPLLKIEAKKEQYFFEHRNIQEYFAAQALSSLTAEKIIGFLSIDKGINKTQPSLFNTITFLLTILDDTKCEILIKWLIEHENVLLFKADSDRIEKYRDKIFQQHFDKHCIKKSYWIDSNGTFPVKEIADFGNSPENFKYLMKHVTKASSHFRVVISALELLHHFTIPPKKKEYLREQLLRMLASDRITEMVKSHILQCITYKDLHHDEVYLHQIFALFRNQTSKQININLLNMLLEYEDKDGFFWFIEAEFLRKIGILKRATEDKAIRGTSWVLEHLIVRLKTPEHFIAIAKYFFDETKNISSNNDFYHKLIERCLFFEGLDNDFLVQLLSSFKDDHRFFYRENLLVKLIQYSGLESQFKAFGYIIEKSRFRNIERILGMTASKENISYIISKYVSGAMDKDRMGLYRNVVEMHRGRELAWDFTKEMLSKNFTFSEPFLSQEEFEMEKEQPQKKKQENFDLLFQKTKLLAKIKAIFDDLGKPINSNNINEIQEEWYLQNGYTKKIDISYSLLGDIAYERDGDISIKVVCSILNSSTYLVNEIKKRIEGEQSPSSKIAISAKQKAYLKKWTLKAATEIDFDQVARYVDSSQYNILRDYDKLQLILYFTATFDFELSQEFLLKSVRFTDIENYSLDEKNAEALKLKIKNKKSLDRQVSENLAAGALFYNVLDNHIQYALDNELSGTYEKIKEYFLNAETSYNVDHKLSQYIKLTDDMELLKEMCQNVRSFNCWTALQLLMQKNTEKKFCKTKAVEYLELKMDDEKNYHYSSALSILFELNSKRALKYILSNLEKQRMPSFREMSFKNFDAVEDYGILNILFEKSYIENKNEIGFGGLSSFTTVYIANLSKSKNGYRKVQKQLNTIKKKFKSIDKKDELFHINHLLDHSTKNYINSQSRALDFAEARERVENLV